MISLALDDQGWPEAVNWPTLVDGALQAAVAETCFASLAVDPRVIEVSVSLADDDDVQQLNREWRGKDKPTNVLSFPMTGPDEIAAIPAGMEVVLGDIILALGVCMAEADEKNIPHQAHAAHLVVHGMLHLLGYDHMNDRDAEEMEALERRALARLGIADPYQDRSS